MRTLWFLLKNIPWNLLQRTAQTCRETSFSRDCFGPAFLLTQYEAAVSPIYCLDRLPEVAGNPFELPRIPSGQETPTRKSSGRQ